MTLERSLCLFLMVLIMLLDTVIENRKFSVHTPEKGGNKK